ncbi:hypothetical protein [Streptomyces sp. HUAS TT20]|uniref:hypothetical protein n=1 Tax=Streptomyces sp. HUAS TT20 TaxID=3447509 RepID=UPI0021D8EF66|nr:hypothetical protein [Streptomyces sp. HUAS 15-9]UXY33231.1 hypothetical protein N8I87_43785 [Streptomyces sp. HUAS 15-9]
MPKKRKKNRKAPRQNSPRRSTSPQQAGAQPADGEADWESLPDEDFDPLSALADRYPTPADAVKAVQAGEPVEWIGDVEGATMRHRVLLADNGEAVVEQAVFLDGTLEQMVLCAAHQAGEHGRDQLHTGVLAALAALHTVIRPIVEAGVRKVRPDYTAAVLESFHEAPEPNGPGTPVFGWRTFHSVGPDTTWDDTIDTATWNSSTMMSGLVGDSDDVPELQPPQLARLLHDHGVPVILCANCGDPITDRHPRWSGVWVSPSNDSGPLCEAPVPALQRPAPRLGWLTDAEFCYPHQPAPVGD